MALRWRRQPNEGGLRSIVQGYRGYQLRDKGVELAHVATIDRHGTGKGWYWYAFGKNTCQTPVKTAEEAKKQATAYVKTKLKELSNGKENKKINN